MAISFIPFHRPSIGQEEIDEVTQTLLSGWLTSGPRTARFEREFAEYVQAPHALGVNSCTAGLHLALAALNIGPQDEVITTPLTFCATVNSILHVGAVPVLADIGEDGNIDPTSIESRITNRTRAIIPVHLGGHACDMKAIWKIAKRHGLAVIEDAAHAVGTRIGDRIVGSADSDGSRSTAVAFSFYATKNLTTGEGGMVTTHDSALADKMRILCLHGISKDAWNRYTDKGNWFYEVAACGYKYNLSDIQSAIGIHQLRKQERFLEVRTSFANLYTGLFKDVSELETPVSLEGTTSAWHLYVIRLNLDRLSIGRDQFIAELKARGVGTSVHFIPIPLHPCYSSMPGLSAELCPRALDLYPRIVSLPLYPGMTEEQVRYVATAAKEIISIHRKSRSVTTLPSQMVSC